MRKGIGSVYDKWNISVVICDTDIPIMVNQVMVVTVKLFKAIKSLAPRNF